ncbi:MAG: metallophosphoesterase family protein [Myxococcales bacterium]
MKLLCVSDIHGELDRLRAVLATAERVSFHKLLVAGDLLFPGPEPLETWRRLIAAGAVLVQGVGDKALAVLDPDSLPAQDDQQREMVERLRVVQGALGELILGRLARLPTHVRVPLEDGRELLLVHGSPMDPTEPITHDLDDDEVDALLGEDPPDVVVCGMSHVPFDRMVGDVRVVGVGSVGQAPAGGGGLVAHATWIESLQSGLTVEQVVIGLR